MPEVNVYALSNRKLALEVVDADGYRTALEMTCNEMYSVIDSAFKCMSALDAADAIKREMKQKLGF